MVPYVSHLFAIIVFSPFEVREQTCTSVVVLFVFLCCLILVRVLVFLVKFGELSDRLLGNSCSLGLR